jgi:hypothetical protein
MLQHLPWFLPIVGLWYPPSVLQRFHQIKSAIGDGSSLNEEGHRRYAAEKRSQPPGHGSDQSDSVATVLRF